MSLDSALGLDRPASDPARFPDHAALKRTDLGRRAARRRGRRRERARNEASGKRLDIQGLRALAVVAVVLNHLTGFPRGGFVGVDVFFVISGYLITGHLMRENASAGRISILDFYRRRVRRLMPAALLTIALTLVGSGLLFASDRFHSVRTDGIWAALFGANWRFINTGTDYFASETPPSPLQHYWSLSVEEQYYVVWPLALIVTFALARRLTRGRAASSLLGAAIAAGVLLLASFAWTIAASGGNGVVAYFSTFTRGWELALGSLLAVLAPRMRGSRWQLTLMSAFGCVVIVVSYFLVTENGFPFPGAILPVLGAGLVVSAAAGRTVAKNPVLTNPAAVYLGDISYSVYLVHFPVIILGDALVADRGASFYVAVPFVVLGLSMLMYHLVETPVRNSRWLVPHHARAAHREGRKIQTGTAGGPAVAIGVGLLAVGLAAGVMLAPKIDQSQQDYQQFVAAAEASPTASSTAAAAVGPQAAALTESLRNAVAATAWPALNPAIDATQPTDPSGCGSAFKPRATCTFGNPNAAHTAYLVGDSTSGRYNFAFQEAMKSLPDWKTIVRGGAGCAWADTTLNENDDNQHADNCPQRNLDITSEIKEVKPDLLVMTTTKMDDDFYQHISANLDQVKGSFGKLVMLDSPPKGDDPQSCYTKVSVPADCASPINPQFDAVLVDGSKKMATAYGGTVVDTRDWFCVNGICPAFAGTTPMRADSTHITLAYSAMLGPVLLEAFAAQNLFVTS